MMIMMDVKSDLDRVVVDQQSAHLEIIQVLKNIMLNFMCTDYSVPADSVQIYTEYRLIFIIDIFIVLQ